MRFFAIEGPPARMLQLRKAYTALQHSIKRSFGRRRADLV
jgi:hypothetical protein